TWPEQFLVVSTPYDFSHHGYALNAYVADPVEWAALFKMPDAGPPGVWRVVFPCDPGMPDDALLDAQHVEAKMQAFHAQGSPYEVRHKVIYRVHQRVASEWRVGRVLLAGDAAHLNNPLGAFGLNSGIHDAVNLAEKLGRVWRSDAGEELLDLYVRQRRAACIDRSRPCRSATSACSRSATPGSSARAWKSWSPPRTTRNRLGRSCSRAR